MATDTRASNQMTSNPGILSNIHLYKGCDSVLIGDGSLLTIDALGDTGITWQNPLHCKCTNDSF